MKKLSWALLCLTMLFAACSKNEDIGEIVSPPKSDESVNRFYGVKRSGPAVETRGVAQKTNLWYPNSTIRVKFLNGSDQFHEKVKTYAAEWEEHANITFLFVNDGKADVRIGFDWNDERYITWSYIGTDCKMVGNQNDATMSFAYWDENTTEKEMKGDVLRAFGQVLGLELEHRHLQFNPKWRQDVSKYWAGEMSDIPWESLKEYVFEPLDETNVLATEAYDASSIMIWPFQPKYSAVTARDYNYELSENDIAFIQKLYPFEMEEIVYVKTEIGSYGVNLRLKIKSEIVIDWGDGNTETVQPVSMDVLKEVAHNYATKGEYAIRIKGKGNSLIYFWCDHEGLIELDISKNRQLEELSCCVTLGRRGLTKLDVSKNTNLTHLHCSWNYLTSLDLSKNIKLVFVSCGTNRLTSLDLSKNTKLVRLYCSNNKIEYIKNISMLSELQYVNAAYTPLYQNRFLEFIASLPDRTNKAKGEFGLEVLFFADYVQYGKTIFDAKNWDLASWAQPWPR